MEKKRGDEDDDGQNLEGKNYAVGPRLGAQRIPEDEPAAGFHEAKHGIHGDAGVFKDSANIREQHQTGKAQLQAQAPKQQREPYAFAIPGKQPRDAKNHRKSQETGKALH
jgi:hypothetical protein